MGHAAEASRLANRRSRTSWIRKRKKKRRTNLLPKHIRHRCPPRLLRRPPIAVASSARLHFHPSPPPRSLAPSISTSAAKSIHPESHAVAFSPPPPASFPLLSAPGVSSSHSPPPPPPSPSPPRLHRTLPTRFLIPISIPIAAPEKAGQYRG
ncbi:hypothetical protein DAI22_04g063500 [Oryza sativa Japonica Group]|nr:hypothetical protein DAI22_04g063500 [Oryza sativa Japonica Group]